MDFAVVSKGSFGYILVPSTKSAGDKLSKIERLFRPDRLWRCGDRWFAFGVDVVFEVGLELRLFFADGSQDDYRRYNTTMSHPVGNGYRGVEGMKDPHDEWFGRIDGGQEAEESVTQGQKPKATRIGGVRTELRPYQAVSREVFDRNGGRLMNFDDCGLGKEVSVNTKILTSTGWRRIGEIEAGETVYSRDGSPTTVTGVFPQGVKPLYRITLSDGATCLAGLDHQWSVADRNSFCPSHRRESPWRIVSTGDLLGMSVLDPKGGVRYVIPFAFPIDRPDTELPIAPYLLGVLLGDGALTGNIGLSVPGDKHFILKKIGGWLDGFGCTVRLQRPDSSSCQAYSPSIGHSRKNRIKEAVAGLGLDVHSPKRFIPEKYMLGSVSQRTELLRGLMDTDGSCKGNRSTFHSMSLPLSEGVVELVRSLGGEATLRTYDRRHHGKGLEYQVRVRMDSICPFSDESPKGLHWRVPKNRKHYGRSIRSIKYESDGEAICISVSHPESLYVIQDYIVTHNTLQSLSCVAGRGKTIVICPAVVKEVWDAQTREHTDMEPAVICGTKPVPKESLDGKDVVIVNYDILHAHMDTLTSLGAKNVIADEVHKISGAGHPPSKKYLIGCKEKADRTGARIAQLEREGKEVPKKLRETHDKALETWSNPPPLVGGSRMGNSSINLMRSVDNRLLLSGTPMQNRMDDLFPLLNLTAPSVFPNRWAFMSKYTNPKKTRFGTEFKGVRNQEELAKAMAPFYVRRLKSEVAKELPSITHVEVAVDLPSELLARYMELEEEYFSPEVGGNLATLMAMRMACAEGKAEPSLSLTDDLIGGQKVIIFSCFMEPMRQISEYYGDRCVTVNGEVSRADRKEAMERFNEDDSCRIFVGGIRSAGEGLTLNAASAVVFNDYDFLPDKHKQAHDRCYRIGQDKPVTVYQMRGKGLWIDDFHHSIHGHKNDLNSKVFGLREADIIKMAMDEAKDRARMGKATKKRKPAKKRK
jgi:hypothetical protein